MDKEIWKDIPLFEGLYQASSLGRIKSVSRRVRHRYGGERIIPQCILRHGLRSGYPSVILMKNGKRINRTVHSLVAEAFITKESPKKVVNHKDGIKTNNNIGNLEWLTQSENLIHAHATGLRARTALREDEEIV